MRTDLYRRMLLIRGFEERVQSLFLRGEVYGTTHLYSGQEAVAVGFASVLGEGDRVACTYRGHGHLLAMGTDPEALLAELLGRATGVNGGRAGSMNVVDPDHGVLGCYGIVGGSIAAATGAALALRGSGAVAVAYFGDGATNQAYFFECLNFAKVLNLPVVFVCENNGYGEYTPTEAVTPRSDRGARRPRWRSPTSPVDGMDVWAVRAAAAEIVERVRGGGGPEFVEARDLPLRRPLAQRSREVPAGGRARPLAASATRCPSRPTGCADDTGCRGRGRPSWTSEQQLERDRAVGARRAVPRAARRGASSRPSVDGSES